MFRYISEFFILAANFPRVIRNMYRNNNIFISVRSRGVIGAGTENTLMVCFLTLMFFVYILMSFVGIKNLSFRLEV